MAITQRRMTADELLRLPDDSCRHELVAGELRTMSPAGAEHGRVSAKVIASLSTYVESAGLGEVYSSETGFVLQREPDTVRAPDAAFLARARLEAAGSVAGFWPGPPDLAVEVVSPSDLYTEVEEKVMAWLEHGTRMVIVLNPRRRTAAVHRPGAPVTVLGTGAVLDGGDVVPGWRLPLAVVFGTDENH
jgi:Uma2 family endonuclease